MAYWIPEGATYEARWNVIELGADGHFYAPGSNVHITRGEIPDYVGMVGPRKPPSAAARAGCRRALAPGQWLVKCGDQDMGTEIPKLCTECGGILRLA